MTSTFELELVSVKLNENTKIPNV